MTKTNKIKLLQKLMLEREKLKTNVTSAINTYAGILTSWTSEAVVASVVDQINDSIDVKIEEQLLQQEEIYKTLEEPVLDKVIEFYLSDEGSKFAVKSPDIAAKIVATKKNFLQQIGISMQHLVAERADEANEDRERREFKERYGFNI